MTYYCGYCNNTPCICEPGVLSDQGTPTIDQRIKAAVLDEREACAKVCEDIAGTGSAVSDYHGGVMDGAGDCADAIRARGE